MNSSSNFESDSALKNFEVDKIIPSILTQEPRVFIQQLADYAQLDPQPELIQLDIIDGQFAPELTVEPNILNQDAVVEALQGVKIDLHLMTVDPIDYVHEVYENPVVRAVIAQVERVHSLREFIEEVKANHFLAGFSLDLYTPFEAIDQDLLPELRVIQIMGGQAGSQGQEFQSKVLEKALLAVQAREELALEYEIYVDIGMNATAIPQALAAGVNGFVVGSALQVEDQQLVWEELQDALRA